MDRTAENAVQVIFYGILIARFLLNTKRNLKAIELLKECLFKVSNLYKDKGKQTDFVRKIYQTVCMQLFSAYNLINDHTSAIKWGSEMVAVLRESGESYELEGKLSFQLAQLYEWQDKYEKAKEFYMNALCISTETCDKELEGSCYKSLGTVFYFLGNHYKAEEYLLKALKIRIEMGDKEGEAGVYGYLGTVYQSLGKYGKAEECHQQALKNRLVMGDRKGEAAEYGKLGNVFYFLGKYDKAEEYHEQALKVLIEIGDKNGEAAATAYGNLGNLFHFLSKHDKAEEHLQKSLKIWIDIGDKEGEAAVYRNLRTVFQSLGEYDKAEEYYMQALKIGIQIGDKEGEAAVCGNLGTVFHAVSEFDKAEEYLQKALKLRIEMGHKNGETTAYGILGDLYYSQGEYSKAKEYYEKALSLAYKIGHIELQFTNHLNLAWVAFNLTGDLHKAVPDLVRTIEKSEKMRRFLEGNDNFKISSLDVHVFPYKSLSKLFSHIRKYNEALYVTELARARALADMMSDQYSVEQEITEDPQSWVGIERIITKEFDSDCLYVSYYGEDLFLWIIKANKPVVFRRKSVIDCLSVNGAKNVDKFFGDISLRNFPTLLTCQVHCEDRSLFPSNATGSLAPSRPVEEDEGENEIKDQYSEPPSLSQCHKMIIDPVAGLLDQPEIIIVPEGPLFKVPFAALKDANEKYLSESFRIRVVPSLMTLKLIQDSPEDYHSQTGALIVGDPEVGYVMYKRRFDRIRPLPCAREEAEMIGRLLGVQPLIGEHATKEAVLRDMPAMSLIHFAAHGDAERGEIALAPSRPFHGTPRENDYLLTMAEVARVRLRAKLVVLSCCHSAQGEIRSEGVVGIARAFLGSGARSVLVALWAIDDEATMKFMSRFYEHLVGGESASESLHQAIKWMRSNRFTNVREWAPFMLIGDNVTFDFKK